VKCDAWHAYPPLSDPLFHAQQVSGSEAQSPISPCIAKPPMLCFLALEDSPDSILNASSCNTVGVTIKRGARCRCLSNCDAVQADFILISKIQKNVSV